jgi:hypothetical protein
MIRFGRKQPGDDVGAARLPVAYLVFFISGFRALLCQVVWQRLLLVFSGTDIQSVTIVVAAFMAGRHDRSLLRDINTDLFPKDEFGVR